MCIRDSLYTLAISIPAPCGFSNSAPAIFIETTDALAGSHISFVSHDSDWFSPSTMVLDLSATRAGVVSGTLEGQSMSDGTTRYSVSSATGSAAATVIGSRTATGMSGTFEGKVIEGFAPPSSNSKTCASTFTWSVVPRP